MRGGHYPFGGGRYRGFVDTDDTSTIADDAPQQNTLVATTTLPPVLTIASAGPSTLGMVSSVETDTALKFTSRLPNSLLPASGVSSTTIPIDESLRFYDEHETLASSSRLAAGTSVVGRAAASRDGKLGSEAAFRHLRAEAIPTSVTHGDARDQFNANSVRLVRDDISRSMTNAEAIDAFLQEWTEYDSADKELVPRIDAQSSTMTVPLEDVVTVLAESVALLLARPAAGALRERREDNWRHR